MCVFFWSISRISKSNERGDLENFLDGEPFSFSIHATMLGSISSYEQIEPTPSTRSTSVTITNIGYT